MGSLRNPVGPLPSTIYWRRRAVAASLVALLALLVVWIVSYDGGGGRNDGKGPGGASPAPSITPGPSQSGPAISEQPGGRDESGTSGGSGSTGGGDGKNGDDTSAGGGGTEGGTGGGDGSGGGSGGTGGSGTGGGTYTGQRVAADSPVPTCAPGALRVTLRATRVTYAPDELPRFQLVARNTSDATCKADLGPAGAVLSVKNTDADQVWSSKDCPRVPGSLLLSVPADGSVTYTVEWDRRQSVPRCATAPAAKAAPGTYLLEVAIPGVKVLPASFALAKD
ncbi:hypothetical protein NX801_29385 [Streptomyces sp. LP05-1]|uniref:Secreted protein n=1 Tax=Streptomyces pyxinae TaxID=2970734 RepID=A0ABT2CRG1_9ACTN|nr:hypothetical protein [Streptomyces sp. LP05-1]MCS0639677.1 hypothetical protein [Streptomyces sp. LP05-1]